MLVGSLPTPPSTGDAAESSSPGDRQYRRFTAAFSPRRERATSAGERASLVLQLEDEDSFGLWLAALRALLAEREPPSPIGPAAIMGSFGAPLEEVRRRHPRLLLRGRHLSGDR